MIIKMVPYVMSYDPAIYTTFYCKYTPLIPTGRWKIKSCAYYENELFIEHKGFIFNTWISESSIEFKAERTETINQCT